MSAPETADDSAWRLVQEWSREATDAHTLLVADEQDGIETLASWAAAS